MQLPAIWNLAKHFERPRKIFFVCGEMFGPLGDIPGMRWCGESNRYYASVDPHREASSSTSHTIHGAHSIDSVIESVAKVPVSEDIVNSFPFSRRKRSRCASEDCAICLRSGLNKNVDPRMRFISLPCKHTFHYYCVASWLTKMSGSCPICRSPADTSLVVAAQAAGGFTY
jgi:hypothetical protein